MTASSVRSALRWTHIALGVLLGSYIYSPLHGQAWAADALRWVIIPLVVASGLAMWKQGPLARLIRPGKP